MSFKRFVNTNIKYYDITLHFYLALDILNIIIIFTDERFYYSNVGDISKKT